MLLFGHAHIPHEKLYHIASIDAISHTPSNATILMDFDENVYELIEHARANAICFALNIHSLREAILAENLDVKYILCSPKQAQSIQKAADTYMFDAKILVHSEDENLIEELASGGIDGIIFSEAIIKVS